MYVVVTRYEGHKSKRPITHAYADGEMTKEWATSLKRKIIREHRKMNPNDKGILTVNVLKVTDVNILNQNFQMIQTDSINSRNTRLELQGPHQGPSGEVLI